MTETASEASGAVSTTDADTAVKEAKESLAAVQKIQAVAHGGTPPPVEEPSTVEKPSTDEVTAPTVAEFADSANALRGLGQTKVAGFLDRAAEGQIQADEDKEAIKEAVAEKPEG